MGEKNEYYMGNRVIEWLESYWGLETIWEKAMENMGEDIETVPYDFFKGSLRLKINDEVMQANYPGIGRERCSYDEPVERGWLKISDEQIGELHEAIQEGEEMVWEEDEIEIEELSDFSVQDPNEMEEGDYEVDADELEKPDEPTTNEE